MEGPYHEHTPVVLKIVCILGGKGGGNEEVGHVVRNGSWLDYEPRYQMDRHAVGRPGTIGRGDCDGERWYLKGPSPIGLVEVSCKRHGKLLTFDVAEAVQAARLGTSRKPKTIPATTARRL